MEIMDLRDIRWVEQVFLRLSDEEKMLDTKMANFNLKVSIKDVGAWIVKSRPSGVVIYNADLAMNGLANMNGELHFTAMHVFYSSLNGVCTLDDCLSNGKITKSGDVQLLRTLFHALSSVRGEVRVSSSNKRMKANEDDGSSSDRGASDESDEEAGQRRLEQGSLMSHSPATSKLRRSVDRVVLSGWLYKQRAWRAGYQCRYFKVYPGRVEYFINNDDSAARSIIDITSAIVVDPVQVRVNGTNDHWMVHVLPRERSQAFRVASEQRGEVGKADITLWAQAFMRAARNELFVTDSDFSPTTPQAYPKSGSAAATGDNFATPGGSTDAVASSSGRLRRRRDAATPASIAEAGAVVAKEASSAYLERYILFVRGATASCMAMKILNGEFTDTTMCVALALFSFSFLLMGSKLFPSVTGAQTGKAQSSQP